MADDKPAEADKSKQRNERDKTYKAIFSLADTHFHQSGWTRETAQENGEHAGT